MPPAFPRRAGGIIVRCSPQRRKPTPPAARSPPDATRSPNPGSSVSLRALATALALALVACTPPASSTPAPDAGLRAALEEQMTASAAAWNRGDLAGHVAIYTDSAEMMGKNGPIRGRETIRGLLERGFWAGGRPAQQLAFRDLVVTPLGRDYAMLTGGCLLTGGGKPDYSCRFTLIWQRTPAGWRVIHDHSS